MAQDSNPLSLVLAVVGAIALILILGSWIFHGAMMSGGMMGEMMGVAALILGLLAVAGIVAATVLLSRRNA